MTGAIVRQLRGVDWLSMVLLLGIGTAGGFVAKAIGLPIPFLVGSLIAVGGFSIAVVAAGRAALPFPQRFRMRFVAVIGVMIGATFSPETLSVLPALWPSLSAMALYVLVGSGIGYVIFRRIGGYDPVTALYGAMPGGLIEATALGEQAGGDVRILSVQHFIRIVLVVMTVPLLFLAWSGHSVGSSAGQAFSSEPAAIADILLIAAIAIVGSTLAPYVRLPAAHMMGPLLLSVVLHSTGVVDIISPTWLLNLAQLIVGTGLGAMFGGSTLNQIVRAVGVGALCVGSLLVLALAFAFALTTVTPISTEALFISFAPGGVSEMGLIALSLGVSPVLVATHHLCRIVFTVLLAGWFGRHVSFRAPPRRDAGQQ